LLGLYLVRCRQLSKKLEADNERKDYERLNERERDDHACLNLAGEFGLASHSVHSAVTCKTLADACAENGEANAEANCQGDSLYCHHCCFMSSVIGDSILVSVSLFRIM
jgi:hypothetical protein